MEVWAGVVVTEATTAAPALLATLVAATDFSADTGW
jgi:hypothetical protein